MNKGSLAKGQRQLMRATLPLNVKSVYHSSTSQQSDTTYSYDLLIEKYLLKLDNQFGCFEQERVATYKVL